MKKHIIFIALSGFCLSGCASYMRESREAEARDVHQLRTVESDVVMLKERVKGIEAAQEQLARDMMEIRTLLSKSGAQSAEFSESLNRVVRQLEDRDLALQKETISSISVKMAEILKSQVSAGGGGSGTMVEHVVQTGENLSAIASAYGVTVPAIVRANKLNDPNTVRVGQKLLIPR